MKIEKVETLDNLPKVTKLMNSRAQGSVCLGLDLYCSRFGELRFSPTKRQTRKSLV